MKIMQNLKSAWAGMLTFLALILLVGAANTEIMTEIGGPLGVNASVKQILIIGDDTGIEATEHAVYDADGTASALSIGTASVTVAGRFTSGGGAVLTTGDTTLTAASSGGIFMVSDEDTLTLPATVVGLTYTFVNIGTDGGNIMVISPAAADFIAGTVSLTDSTTGSVGSDVNEDVINTKSSAINGDTITIVGDGVDGWYILRSSGIFVSE